MRFFLWRYRRHAACAAVIVGIAGLVLGRDEWLSITGATRNSSSVLAIVLAVVWFAICNRHQTPRR
jgi:hypothetical protein